MSKQLIERTTTISTTTEILEKVIKRKKITVTKKKINKFNLDSKEYLNYKKMILNGEKICDLNGNSDFWVELYYVKDSRELVKNIKYHAFNNELDQNHVNNIYNDLKKVLKKNRFFVNPVALVEYCEKDDINYKDLIEIIDGHHRIEALKNIYNDDPEANVELVVYLYKTPLPSSNETKIIFESYNKVKPYDNFYKKVQLRYFIQNKFDKVFPGCLKDTRNRGRNYRPFINAKDLYDEIDKKIDSVDNIIYRDMNKFVDYMIKFNEKLSQFKKEDFNDVKTFGMSKLSERTYKSAKEKNFFLGLVSIPILVEKCIVSSWIE